MRFLASGVAHLSYPGGGMFLPVRTPYDRQVLIDHVGNRVRGEKPVQVLIDKQRWLIDRHASNPATCSACQRPIEIACQEPLRDGSLYCLRCAFLDESIADKWLHPWRRSA